MLAWNAGVNVKNNKDHVNGVVLVFAADWAGMIRPMDVMEHVGLQDEAMCVFLPWVNISWSKINIDPKIFYMYNYP